MAKQNFIIRFKSGGCYIAAAPEDWTFPGFVLSIKQIGHWMDEYIYIAADEIAVIHPAGIRIDQTGEVVPFRPQVVPPVQPVPSAPQPDHTPEPGIPAE